MTDQTKSVVDDMDDLELLTAMLNGHLDPERVEAVKQRLTDDPAFREFAAPLLLTWSIPPHLERKPRPEGEWEREYHAFIDRMRARDLRPEPARPSAWRKHPLWRVGRLLVLMLLLYPALLLGIYGLSLFGVFTPEAEPGTIAEDVARASRASAEVVPLDQEWDSLGAGIWMRTEGNHFISSGRTGKDGVKRLDLVGTARFRVMALDSLEPRVRARAIEVHTRAGVISAGESEFTVIARADTTVVVAHPIRRRPAVQAWSSMIGASTVEDDGVRSTISLREFEGAILRRRQRPEPIRAEVTIKADPRTP